MSKARYKQLWKVKSKYSLEQLLASADLLMQAAYEYFAWCDKHPLTRPEAVKSGSECGRIIDVPMQRPYSLMGFCSYIGCSVAYLEVFKLNCGADVAEVIARAEDIIANHLFEGATTGLYSVSMISKLRGERESSNTEQSARDSVLHIEVIDEKTREQLLKLKDRLSA